MDTVDLGSSSTESAVTPNLRMRDYVPFSQPIGGLLWESVKGGLGIELTS